MKRGPSSGLAVSSLEVYTTPALSGDRGGIGTPAREGVLQTLTFAGHHEYPLLGSSNERIRGRRAKNHLIDLAYRSKSCSPTPKS